MKLAAVPFKKIQNGSKIIESRLYDDKRSLISIGDYIEFSNNSNPQEKVKTKVKALYGYGTFLELFSQFPSEYFGEESKDFLIEEIETFYSKEDQKKFGVLGIKIELV
jgi:ASC-1-like (ASCH) protein